MAKRDMDNTYPIFIPQGHGFSVFLLQPDGSEEVVLSNIPTFGDAMYEARVVASSDKSLRVGVAGCTEKNCGLLFAKDVGRSYECVTPDGKQYVS